MEMAVYKIMKVLNVLLCLTGTVYSFDPCLSYKKLVNSDIRGTGCSVSDAGGYSFCDRLLHDGWYAVEDEGNYSKIADTCPGFAKCGTTNPMWMKGQHPTVEEGIVDREVCVRGIQTRECCKHTYTIQVKNCDYYYVYNLKHTDACDEAYCFGDGECKRRDIDVSKQEVPDINAVDPCVVHKSLHTTERRGSACSSLKTGSTLCDRLLSPGWYAASIDDKYLDMPNSCVNVTSCSTTSPIWMMGSTPKLQDGIVQRKACVRGILINECCKKQYDILVKNCGSYNVYYLPYTDMCDEAFCFGTQTCQQIPDYVTHVSTTNHKDLHVDHKDRGISSLELTIACLLVAVLMVSLAILFHRLWCKRAKKIHTQQDKEKSVNDARFWVSNSKNDKQTIYVTI